MHMNVGAFDEPIAEELARTSVKPRRIVTDADIGLLVELAKRYYEGMLHGKIEMLEQPSRWRAISGRSRWTTGPARAVEFVAMVGGPNAGGEPGADYSLLIELLDITGPVAVIKVKDRFRGRTYVDYLTVVKTGAVWRIVNKAFTTVD